jgi:hypothetical protein
MNRLGYVDVFGVRPSSIGISARFFVALFVLSASLIAVGVLGLRGPSDAPTLIRQADRALYSAKKNGRDRVETITPGEGATSPLSSVSSGR